MKEKTDIMYGKIIVLNKKKETLIEHAVFKKGSKFYKKMPILKIIDVKKVGETNTSNRYSKVKASNETRNKITGAYE